MLPPSATMTINGVIEFQDVHDIARNVTVHVRVENSQNADASAQTVAEQVIEGGAIAPGAETLPFDVKGIPQNPKARYVVRVHADVDGDGRVSRGDYISTQSFPLEVTGLSGLKIVARHLT